MSRIVTISGAIAALAATALLAGEPRSWTPWTTWLVHVDRAHLVNDVLGWILIAAWIEPRVGSVRLAAWTAFGVLLGAVTFGAVHGFDQKLFGLSAMLVTVAAAALASQWRSSIVVRLALAGLVVVTAAEAWLGARGPLVPQGKSWLATSPAIARVPVVHLVAAFGGLAVGAVAARRRQGASGARGTDTVRGQPGYCCVSSSGSA